MAKGATIFKVDLERSDLGANVYTTHALTLARHASENDERMMVRVLAFALFAPADDGQGGLEFGRGLSDDEPALWRRDLTGRIEHWVEVGEPDFRRLKEAHGRAARVSVFGYRANFPAWWEGVAQEAARFQHLDVWCVAPAELKAFVALVDRHMRLTITLQEGTAWCTDGNGTTVELTLTRLR